MTLEQEFELRPENSIGADGAEGVGLMPIEDLDFNDVLDGDTELESDDE